MPTLGSSGTPATARMDTISLPTDTPATGLTVVEAAASAALEPQERREPKDRQDGTALALGTAPPTTARSSMASATVAASKSAMTRPREPCVIAGPDTNSHPTAVPALMWTSVVRTHQRAGLARCASTPSAAGIVSPSPSASARPLRNLHGTSRQRRKAPRTAATTPRT